MFSARQSLQKNPLIGKTLLKHLGFPQKRPLLISFGIRPQQKQQIN